jgi:hypothetical protein
MNETKQTVRSTTEHQPTGRQSSGRQQTRRAATLVQRPCGQATVATVRHCSVLRSWVRSFADTHSVDHARTSFPLLCPRLPIRHDGWRGNLTKRPKRRFRSRWLTRRIQRWSLGGSLTPLRCSRAIRHAPRRVTRSLTGLQPGTTNCRLCGGMIGAGEAGE